MVQATDSLSVAGEIVNLNGSANGFVHGRKSAGCEIVNDNLAANGFVHGRKSAGCEI